MVLFTTLDDPLQLVKEAMGFLRFKAAVFAGMAGRALRVNLDQEGILITIQQYLFHPKEIALSLTLGPKTIFGTREKSDFSFAFGFFKSFLVHIAQHQHLLTLVMLDDDW